MRKNIFSVILSTDYYCFDVRTFRKTEFSEDIDSYLLVDKQRYFNIYLNKRNVVKLRQQNVLCEDIKQDTERSYLSMFVIKLNVMHKIHFYLSIVCVFFLPDDS